MKYLAVFMSVLSIFTGNSLASKCGDILEGKSGNFNSPNYPSSYPENVECQWKIVAPKGSKKIVIMFPKFDVEWGPSCNYDYVKILDENKKQIGRKICGRKDDFQVDVPGSTAYVVLYSDYEATERGFTATFQAVLPSKPPSKGDCDFDDGLCQDWRNDVTGDFEWSVGSGSTPSALTGPNTDHSGKGQYLFTESSPPRKEGDKARIVSTSLQNVRCLKFYYFMYGLIGVGKLRVYLGHSSGKTTLLWQRSGDQGQKWKKVQLPLPVNGSMSFKIIFEGEVGKSDYSDMAIDDIEFSKDTCKSNECKKDLQGLSGRFSTPKFPEKYPGDSRCMWNITGPAATKKIVLKFHKFDLETSHGCSKDFIKIYNKNGVQVGPHYCGLYPEGFGVKINGNVAIIYFSSNFFIAREGFNASFKAILTEHTGDCDFDNGLCTWTNSKMDDFDWTIQSGRTPSFFTGPSSDYLGLGKYAYIESSHRHPGDRAQLSSQLMSGTKCMQFVYNMRGIYMGAINVFQAYGQIRNVLLSLSGNHDRPWHKAVVNIPDVARLYKIIVVGVVGDGFTSDAAIDEISFSTGHCPSQACGGYLTTPSGVIESPKYPANYPNNEVCQWKINPLPYYNKISVLFEEFDLEVSSNCRKDNVQISDGYKTQVGEKLCGQKRNLESSSINITGASAYVKFTSNDAIMESGFKATYQAIGKRASCGGQLSGATGMFTSPNYPRHYSTDEICDWEITGSNASSWLEITFNDFHIEDTIVCYYNYLIVYDGIHGDEVGRYCGPYAPALIIIPSNVTNVRFTTSRHGAARGFVAQWRMISPKNGAK